MDESLKPFLAPQGVVVIGASTVPQKLGYGIARDLAESGYRGAIAFVSQRAGELFGHPLYADLAQVPDPVDLAVIAVPAAAMLASLQACAGRGVRAAILISAGFREAGPEGAVLEQECAAFAREHGIRLLGPNCIGTIDTHLPLDTTFLPPPLPEPGGLAFLSHSGAFCAAIIDWSRGEGFGFSQVVSLGNQADVTETDMLPVVAADEHTRAIVMYLEGMADGRRFVESAARVTRSKPVIALKVGRTATGQKAAASHTGAMAGSDTAFAAAFERAGILRAASAEQMFDWARALENCPLPKGRRVAILTNAGGPGVIAADALAAERLELAPISDATRDALAARLPAAASVQNPVDMLASAAPEDYAECLRLLLADPGTDAALAIVPPPPMFTAQAVADAIIPVAQASGKPVVVALMGAPLVEGARAALRCTRIPTYAFPERAVSALGALARRSEYLAIPVEPRTRPHVESAAGSFSSAEELLSRYGIPVAQPRLARSAEEAAQVAAELGFPVVMKISSPQVVHKSDVGGVVLDVMSVADAHSAYTQIVRDVRAHVPGASIHGVQLQKQVRAGQEVIIGAIQDPSFGALAMFGSGGVEAEGMHDVAFALAPLSKREALELMSRTWAGRKLDGFRNLPPADKEAAAEALVRLSWLAHAHPEIGEIEVNPLRVLQQGAVALDARIVPNTRASQP